MLSLKKYLLILCCLWIIKKSSGKLQKQLEQRDHRRDEARGSIKSKYDDKLRSMADECRTSRSRTYRDNRNRVQPEKTLRMWSLRPRRNWQNPALLQENPKNPH